MLWARPPAGLSAAALLAACGGGSSDSASKESAPSLIAKPADTTSKAKRGGIMFLARANNPGDFDPLTGQGSMTSTHTSAVYSRLHVAQGRQVPQRRSTARIEGDAATSWELSPDATQITLKLRGMPFDQRAPTNGRAMTATDVKFSWDKFAAKQGLRGELANSVSPDSPILGVQVMDPKTVVFKLAYPYAPIAELLAWHNYIQIEPTEADGGFDPRTDMRGSGAWFMEEYRPSQVMRLRRNPQWYDKERPYLDGIDVVIVPENATGLAQLRAGNLWEYVNLSPEDVIPTKRALPELTMLQKPSFSDRTMPDQVGVGYVPGSPFMDERVRYAISMLQDRDLWMNTFYNLDKFKAEGLDVPTRINTMITPGQEGYWVDPKDKAFGDAGKYFQYNAAEAKKLLQAATGNKLPLEAEFTWTANGYGPVYNRQVEVMAGMLQAGGDFKFKMNQVDYQSVFRAQYSNAPGTYSGICLTIGPRRRQHRPLPVRQLPQQGLEAQVPVQGRHGGIDDPQAARRVGPGQAQADRPRHAEVHVDQDVLRAVRRRSARLPARLAVHGQLRRLLSWATPWPEEYTYRWFDESKKKS